MEDFLDKVYANTSDDTRDLYAQWATSYDQEVGENGYATPARAAKALARRVTDVETPILDYGCGTGLSGVALRAAGFSTLHGIDVSKEMVAIADDKKAYQTIRVFDPDAPPPVKKGEFDVITAIGVIGIGAAPLHIFDTIIALLEPGGLFAFSFNDHALSDPAFETKVSDYVDTGKAKLLLREYGDHLPGAGLKSNVYILKVL
ncbi:MAG: methyltransferase type 11 [Aestuariivita sp.]|nr:methyltransferase type 11 [Aestuariivita sp.]